MIERCGDRQLKCDGLQKWPFHLFIESLPVMLQAALLLLACGLCRYMASINTTVAAVLIGLTLLGVLFYVGIIVTGAYSYACPFQTPASVPLRNLWTKVCPRLTFASLPIPRPLHILRNTVRNCDFASHPSLTGIRRHVCSVWNRIQLGILRASLCLPSLGLDTLPSFHRPSLPITQESPPSDIQEVTRWLSPKDTAVMQTTSVNDARCVSWILRHITDLEALDAAIRLAGTIRWFEDGADAVPPYDVIISAFHACFDSNGEVYPGSRDRAYYSGRAMVWIHTLAKCESDERARMFPLPDTQYKAPDSDRDLTRLLYAIPEGYVEFFRYLLYADEGNTPSYLRWASDIMLHLSWATRSTLDHRAFEGQLSFSRVISPPLDAVLNCLLVCCNFLGFPVEEEVLRVQDKSCGVFRSCSLSYSCHCSLVIAWNWL